MRLRTRGEQKAYLDGFERCAECIKKYLSDEGKKMLECHLMAVRSVVEIETQKSEDKEKIANKYNCKNCMHYGNFEAFYGEVYACELYECHYKRKEVSE